VIDLGNNQFVNSFWHCFGVKDEIVDETTALEMLAASRTKLIPINCHALDTKGPIIGHGSVTYERLKRKPLLHNTVPCLNINLQTTAKDAVDVAEKAREMTGIDLLKLEVLTEDLLRSDDYALIEAADTLLYRGFRVMPLLSDDWIAAKWFADRTESPVLRIMGSPIGSGEGIRNSDRVDQIVALGIPVVLDGGIGTIAQAKQAFDLGCAGVLVNSCLFKHPRGPVEALRDFRQGLFKPSEQLRQLA
jgi:thiazole synthase